MIACLSLTVSILIACVIILEATRPVGASVPRLEKPPPVPFSPVEPGGVAAVCIKRDEGAGVGTASRLGTTSRLVVGASVTAAPAVSDPPATPGAAAPASEPEYDESILTPCVTSLQCSNCTEGRLQCVTISSTSVLNEDGTFVTPVRVQLQGDDEARTPYAVSVTTPGSYCLPEYVNKCDPSTSNSVYADGRWSCECKFPSVFTSSVPGASCTVPIGCGAQVPQSDSTGAPILFSRYAGDDTSTGETRPVFTDGYVYPNRVTSRNAAATEPCVVPVMATTVEVDVGKSEPFKYTTYVPSARSDPTCHARTYTNECRVLSNDGTVFQTIRGSGNPGDPVRRRVSPAFFVPVPPGLQRCPDNWFGHGTAASPCQPTRDAGDGTEKLVMFDDAGDWNGLFTRIDDVRRYKRPSGSTPATYGELKWKTVNEDQGPLGDPDCIGGTFSTYDDTFDLAHQDFFADPQYCVTNLAGDKCLAATGFRYRAWQETVDGPLAEGAKCTCDGFAVSSNVNGVVTSNMREAAGADDDTSSRWVCAADSCADPRTSPRGKFNASTNECDCPPFNTGDTAEAGHFPFKTSIPWAAAHEAASCLADPCNPGGFASRATDVLSSNASDGTKCGAQFGCMDDDRCYIKSSYTCTLDAECVGKTSTGGASRCFKSPDPKEKDKYCYYKDMSRAKAGTVCNHGVYMETTKCPECALGKLYDATSLKCTPYCVCDKNYEQVEDASSPIGYTCKKKCEGDGVCANNGACLLDESTGAYTCACTSCWTGATCGKFPTTGKPGDACTKNKECCSGKCKKPIAWLKGICT